MGLYDYIGDDGSQVKCFYIPYFTIKKDKDGKYHASFNTSGGRMVSVNKAPFMTPYYNYGPNFAILDYEIMWDGDNTTIFFVKDGNWTETRILSELQENYPLPPVIIDANGVRYKAKTIADIKQLIHDYTQSAKERKTLTESYMKMRGLTPEMDFEKMKTMSNEEKHREFTIRNIVHKDVYSICIEPVSKRWEDESHDSDVSLLGKIFAYYQDVIARNLDRHEYEWYVACRDALEKLQKTHKDPVVDYISWCNQEGIEINSDEVIAFFDKHSKKPSAEMQAEYEKYLEKRGY